MPQVDQVAVVRENLCRLVMIRPAVPAERFDRFGTERRGRPLALVLVKRAKAVALMVCAFSGRVSTPPDALTCAPEVFHDKRLISSLTLPAIRVVFSPFFHVACRRDSAGGDVAGRPASNKATTFLAEKPMNGKNTGQILLSLPKSNPEIMKRLNLL